MPHDLHRGGRRIYLVTADSKNPIRAFSGSSYHLALEGMRHGLISGMVNLYPRGLGGWLTYARYGWWKLSRGFPKQRGFIYTDAFLDAAWKQHLPALRESTVINNFQVFGSHFLRCYREFGIDPYPYVDGTLTEYFYNYRAFDTADLDEAVIRRAIEVERAGYARCRKIIVMSRRSAAHVARDYAQPAEKIHVVPPAANIPEPLLDSIESRPERRRASGATLTVGFIGLSPARKGLPTIADAVTLLRRSGYDVRLHVVGKCPGAFAGRDGITDFGVVDKAVDTEKFVQIVRDLDVGCMLSRAELAGIGLLEFLRLGVPVIATDVGGIPDIVELGAGILVPAEISPADLARQFARLIDDPERLAELRERARHNRRNASWSRVVDALKGILSN
jgi:glycosyltransferase involved in cell wall biosynthesis